MSLTQVNSPAASRGFQLGIEPATVAIIASTAIKLIQLGLGYRAAMREAMRQKEEARELLQSQLREIAWQMYLDFPAITYPDWYDIVEHEYLSAKSTPPPVPAPAPVPKAESAAGLFLALGGIVALFFLIGGRKS